MGGKDVSEHRVQAVRETLRAEIEARLRQAATMEALAKVGSRESLQTQLEAKRDFHSQSSPCFCIIVHITSLF